MRDFFSGASAIRGRGPLLHTPYTEEQNSRKRRTPSCKFSSDVV